MLMKTLETRFCLEMPVNCMIKKMFAFDVDGVLIDAQPGGFIQLAEKMGKDVSKLHEEYQKRKNKGPWGLDKLAKLFEGCKKDELVSKANEIVSKSLMPGAKETILELKQMGFIIGVFTSNPLEIIDALKIYMQIDVAVGNELIYNNETATGGIIKMDRYQKAEKLKDYVQKNDISQLYIVGDSITDLPMAELGTFISFNSKDIEVDNKARYIIKNKNLKEILKLL